MLDLSMGLERTIENLMECVWNLPGNCDENEIKRVVNVLRDLTQEEFDELQALTCEDCEVDDE